MKHAPDVGSLARARRRTRCAAWAALVTLLVLPPLLACGREDGTTPSSASTKTGAPAVPPAARRIASLSPLASALLLELDAVDRIVAVDADSRALPALGARPPIPAGDDAAFLAILAVEPDLIVVPDSRAELAARLAGANYRTVIAAVHDFDDGFTLWGDLAGRLGLATAARDRIAAASRPFAEIEAESLGSSRPRVAAIETFEPLALAGDRSFATALVELAGGESVSPDGRASNVPVDREALRALAPQLLVHTSPRPIPEAERRARAAELASIAPLVFVELDPDRFYAPETAEAARTLRAAIAPLARPLAEAR